MATCLISDLKNHLNQEVTIRGWMYNKRGSGKIFFLQLRDGSGTVQAIAEASSVSPETLEAAEKLTMESSVKITGKVSAHPKQADTYELQITNIEIVHLVEEEYPIAKKEHGIDFLMDHRHLWLRSPKQWAKKSQKYNY